MSISSVTGDGIEQFKQLLIKNIWGENIGDSSDVMIGEERQKVALEDAQQALDRVVAAEADRAGLEIVALELRSAVTALGQITGQEIGDEVLDRIFAKFCIGK
jgi:tRNA modification GTPase